jgi:lipid-A-disaccharide synthase-like uncharacterized protein
LYVLRTFLVALSVRLWDIIKCIMSDSSTWRFARRWLESQQEMKSRITRMRSKIKSLTWYCPGKYVLLRGNNTAVICTYITVFCEIRGFHIIDVQDPGLSMIIDSRRFERMCRFHVHGSGRPRILQKWHLGGQGTVVNVALMGYTICAEFLCVMHWNISTWKIRKVMGG